MFSNFQFTPPIFKPSFNIVTVPPTDEELFELGIVLYHEGVGEYALGEILVINDTAFMFLDAQATCLLVFDEDGSFNNDVRTILSKIWYNRKHKNLNVRIE